MTAETFNLLEIQPGTRLRMANGAVVEVVENPADGMWLFCRYLAHPANPALVVDGEHAIFAQDLVAFDDAAS